ncbi:MAG: hypothetical protein HYR91_04015 [Flavobacteriia bacterium]|nr:hypothetical protein [Flavobacteriia bacterium]
MHNDKTPNYLPYPAFPYQRDIYVKEDFENSKRDMFQYEKFHLNFPVENNIMKWNDSISKKYSKEKSIEGIKNRFNNCQKSIYMTIENLKQDPRFLNFIVKYRTEGFKDWQIVLSIFNFILNYKINYFEKVEFNDESTVKQHYNDLMKKYKNIDEKDCYIHFPLEAFESESFTSQIKILYLIILDSYSLENKSITPNINSIKEFLDTRFNLSEDDYNENNPLSDVG